MTSANDDKDVKNITEENATKGKSQLIGTHKTLNAESLNDVPFVERGSVLASAWRAATNPLGSGILLRNLHRVTMLYVLQEEWAKLDNSIKDELRSSVEGCTAALEKLPNQVGGVRRLRHLLRTSHEPWQHPVLKDIMEGGTPSKEDVEAWFREECCAGALERLRQLCAAGGSACSGAGLRLARALLLLPPTAGARRHALDAHLVLLFRQGKTTDCIAEIKALDTREAVAVIGRLSTRDKSNGRLWKHAHDTALLCAQVMVAACLVRPLQGGELSTLARQLALLYTPHPQRLPPAFRKLLQPAETSMHIYTVCRVVQHQFGETMRSFVCELYIRALTTGMNELEKQKLQDEGGEAVKTTSHQLARWFLNLADYLISNRSVEAECVLTAFSLHPSKEYYRRIEDCASWMEQHNKSAVSEEDGEHSKAHMGIEHSKIALDESVNKNNPIDSIADSLEKNLVTDLSKVSDAVDALIRLGIDGDQKNDTSYSKNYLIKVCDEKSKKECNPVKDLKACDGKGLAQRLISAAVLEGEGLGLTSEMCRDLAVLLSGPRLKMLTWELSWKDLSHHCLSYMEATQEGTHISVTKELKFLHLDYSQLEVHEPEVHDIYFGIEKGYEHHLEIESDEEDYWDKDEEQEKPAIKTEVVNKIEDIDGFTDDKKNTKKCKKKTSKKILSPLDETKKVKKKEKIPSDPNASQGKVKKKKQSSKDPNGGADGNNQVKINKNSSFYRSNAVAVAIKVKPLDEKTIDTEKKSKKERRKNKPPLKTCQFSNFNKSQFSTLCSSVKSEPKPSCSNISPAPNRDFLGAFLKQHHIERGRNELESNFANIPSEVRLQNSITIVPKPIPKFIETSKSSLIKSEPEQVSQTIQNNINNQINQPTSKQKRVQHISLYRLQMDRYEAWKNKQLDLELKMISKPSINPQTTPTTIKKEIDCTQNSDVPATKTSSSKIGVDSMKSVLKTYNYNSKRQCTSDIQNDNRTIKKEIDLKEIDDILPNVVKVEQPHLTPRTKPEPQPLGKSSLLTFRKSNTKKIHCSVINTTPTQSTKEQFLENIIIPKQEPHSLQGRQATNYSQYSPRPQTSERPASDSVLVSQPIKQEKITTYVNQSPQYAKIKNSSLLQEALSEIRTTLNSPSHALQKQEMVALPGFDQLKNHSYSDLVSTAEKQCSTSTIVDAKNGTFNSTNVYKNWLSTSNDDINNSPNLQLSQIKSEPVTPIKLYCTESLPYSNNSVSASNIFSTPTNASNNKEVILNYSGKTTQNSVITNSQNEPTSNVIKNAYLGSVQKHVLKSFSQNLVKSENRIESSNEHQNIFQNHTKDVSKFFRNNFLEKSPLTNIKVKNPFGWNINEKLQPKTTETKIPRKNQSCKIRNVISNKNTTKPKEIKQKNDHQFTDLQNDSTCEALMKLNKIMDMKIQKLHSKLISTPTENNTNIECNKKAVIVQHSAENLCLKDTILTPETSNHQTVKKILSDTSVMMENNVKNVKLADDPYEAFLNEMHAMVNAGSEVSLIKLQPNINQTHPIKHEQSDSIRTASPTLTVGNIKGKLTKRVQVDVQKIKDVLNKLQSEPTQENSKQRQTLFNYLLNRSISLKDSKIAGESVPQTYARKNYTSIMKKQTALKSVSANENQTNVSCDNSAILRISPEVEVVRSSKGVIPYQKKCFDQSNILSSNSTVSNSNPVITNKKLGNKIINNKNKLDGLIKTEGNVQSQNKINTTKANKKKLSEKGDSNATLSFPCKSKTLDTLKNPIKIKNSSIYLPSISKNNDHSKIVPESGSNSIQTFKSVDHSEPLKKLVVVTTSPSSLHEPIQQGNQWTPMHWGMRHMKTLSSSKTSPLPSFSTFYKIESDTPNLINFPNKQCGVQHMISQTPSSCNLIAKQTMEIFPVNLCKTENVTQNNNAMNQSNNHISIKSNNVDKVNILISKPPNNNDVYSNEKILEKRLPENVQDTVVQILEQKSDSKDFSDIMDVIEQDLQRSTFSLPMVENVLNDSVIDKANKFQEFSKHSSTGIIDNNHNNDETKLNEALSKSITLDEIKNDLPPSILRDTIDVERRDIKYVEDFLSSVENMDLPTITLNSKDDSGCKDISTSSTYEIDDISLTNSEIMCTSAKEFKESVCELIKDIEPSNSTLEFHSEKELQVKKQGLDGIYVKDKNIIPAKDDQHGSIEILGNLIDNNTCENIPSKDLPQIPEELLSDLNESSKTSVRDEVLSKSTETENGTESSKMKISLESLENNEVISFRKCDQIMSISPNLSEISFKISVLPDNQNNTKEKVNVDAENTNSVNKEIIEDVTIDDSVNTVENHPSYIDTHLCLERSLSVSIDTKESDNEAVVNNSNENVNKSLSQYETRPDICYGDLKFKPNYSEEFTSKENKVLSGSSKTTNIKNEDSIISPNIKEVIEFAKETDLQTTNKENKDFNSVNSVIANENKDKSSHYETQPGISCHEDFKSNPNYSEELTSQENEVSSVSSKINNIKNEDSSISPNMKEVIEFAKETDLQTTNKENKDFNYVKSVIGNENKNKSLSQYETQPGITCHEDFKSNPNYSEELTLKENEVSNFSSKTTNIENVGSIISPNMKEVIEFAKDTDLETTNKENKDLNSADGNIETSRIELIKSNFATLLTDCYVKLTPNPIITKSLLEKYSSTEKTMKDVNQCRTGENITKEELIVSNHQISITNNDSFTSISTECISAPVVIDNSPTQNILDPEFIDLISDDDKISDDEKLPDIELISINEMKSNEKSKNAKRLHEDEIETMVDPNTLGIDKNVGTKLAKRKPNIPVPIFITMFGNIIQSNTNLGKRSRMSDENMSQKKKNSNDCDKILVIFPNTPNVIKVDSMPRIDQPKLKMVCEVQLMNYNFTKSQIKILMEQYKNSQISLDKQRKLPSRHSKRKILTEKGRENNDSFMDIQNLDFNYDSDKGNEVIKKIEILPSKRPKKATKNQRSAAIKETIKPSTRIALKEVAFKNLHDIVATNDAMDINVPIRDTIKESDKDSDVIYISEESDKEDDKSITKLIVIDDDLAIIEDNQTEPAYKINTGKNQRQHFKNKSGKDLNKKDILNVTKNYFTKRKLNINPLAVKISSLKNIITESKILKQSKQYPKTSENIDTNKHEEINEGKTPIVLTESTKESYGIKTIQEIPNDFMIEIVLGDDLEEISCTNDVTKKSDDINHNSSHGLDITDHLEDLELNIKKELDDKKDETDTNVKCDSFIGKDTEIMNVLLGDVGRNCDKEMESNEIDTSNLTNNIEKNASVIQLDTKKCVSFLDQVDNQHIIVNNLVSKRDNYVKTIEPVNTVMLLPLSNIFSPSRKKESDELGFEVSIENMEILPQDLKVSEGENIETGKSTHLSISSETLCDAIEDKIEYSVDNNELNSNFHDRSLSQQTFISDIGRNKNSDTEVIISSGKIELSSPLTSFLSNANNCFGKQDTQIENLQETSNSTQNEIEKKLTSECHLSKTYKKDSCYDISINLESENMVSQKCNNHFELLKESGSELSHSKNHNVKIHDTLLSDNFINLNEPLNEIKIIDSHKVSCRNSNIENSSLVEFSSRTNKNVIKVDDIDALIEKNINTQSDALFEVENITTKRTIAKVIEKDNNDCMNFILCTKLNKNIEENKSDDISKDSIEKITNKITGQEKNFDDHSIIESTLSHDKLINLIILGDKAATNEFENSTTNNEIKIRSNECSPIRKISEMKSKLTSTKLINSNELSESETHSQCNEALQHLITTNAFHCTTNDVTTTTDFSPLDNTTQCVGDGKAIIQHIDSKDTAIIDSSQCIINEIKTTDDYTPSTVHDELIKVDTTQHTTDNDGLTPNDMVSITVDTNQCKIQDEVIKSTDNTQNIAPCSVREIITTADDVSGDTLLENLSILRTSTPIHDLKPEEEVIKIGTEDTETNIKGISVSSYVNLTTDAVDNLSHTLIKDNIKSHLIPVIYTTIEDLSSSKRKLVEDENENSSLSQKVCTGKDQSDSIYSTTSEECVPVELLGSCESQKNYKELESVQLKCKKIESVISMSTFTEGTNNETEMNATDFSCSFNHDSGLSFKNKQLDEISSNDNVIGQIDEKIKNIPEPLNKLPKPPDSNVATEEASYTFSVKDFDNFEAITKTHLNHEITENNTNDNNDESFEYVCVDTNEINVAPLLQNCLSKSENTIATENYENLSFKTPVKTYQKINSSNPRKRKISVIKSVTNVKSKNPRINLPKITSRRVNSVIRQIYDHFSVKEVMLMENHLLDFKDSLYSEGMELVSLKKNIVEFNAGDFLYDSTSREESFYNCESRPRESFYSPIFTEEERNFDIDMPIDDFIINNLDVEESRVKRGKRISERKKGSRYDREGFGFRSDRENISDLLHGRLEGPAALSDSPNPRLPKTLNTKNYSQVLNTTANAKIWQTVQRQIILQANLENHFNNSVFKRKRVKMIGKAKKNTSPLSNKNANHEDKLLCKKNIKNILVNNKINLRSRTTCVEDILSRVPGMRDFDHIRPNPLKVTVGVVQVGQLPVSSAQQSPLPGTPTRANTTGDYNIEVASNNSIEYQSPSQEESHQSGSQENEIQEIKNVENEEQNIDSVKTQDSDKCNNENLNSEDSSTAVENKNKPEEVNFINVENTRELLNTQSSTVNDSINVNTSSSGPVTMDGPVQLIFTSQPIIQQNYNLSSDSQGEQKEGENNMDSSINSIQNNSNFNPVSRAQTLVNILSQKIIRPPVAGGTQQVQMATFPKGTPISALSLQQALAQILPPPLSQASGDGSPSVTHSSGPQVVHIVQGKAGQPGGSFSGLLVDNSQQSVINTSGGTQVLHIVQGKNAGSSANPTVVGQQQLTGTTFGGLSLVDTGSQQGGNQVLHIVNAGNQAKNNAAAAQLLKRVNLLTSLTNSQGHNEQKMVQFVCKAADGKAIQLNAQHQRGMVLRLQPIETPGSVVQKVNENQTTVTSQILQQGPKKSPSNDQSQEIKSRSIYEENYAKFIQNSSTKLSPISPEKSTSLPKFNQVFGKSVYQDNAISKNDAGECNQNQSSSTTASEHSPELANAISLAQMGQLSSPPLLIRKTQPGTTQNIVGQVKPTVTPMNIQAMHGGVIYTRQIPVNIGGGQTINLITVPSTELLDEAHLQAIQKQAQEKANISDQQVEQQVIKLVPQQDQNPQNVTVCHMDSASDDANQGFSDQNTINTHPLLAQMRIKVPMLSKGGTQMVTGTRVVRPVLQIQRNVIPGTNPAVYQQLVLTTAPALRPPTPAPQTTVRPPRPPTATPQQESNLSSSTLEQLREFDMVLEQVKERSTVQPGSNSNSAFSESSPQRQTVDSNDTVINQTSHNLGQSTQREVLYSIGPNQTVNVTYVNQKVISGTPTVLTTSFPQNQEMATIVNMGQQNSPALQVAHGIANSINHPKPSTPTKVSNKSMKPKSSKPPSVAPSSSKSSPVVPKTSLQKPLEDEQTTQRILYILAEYKEQVENSPDKDKPAPRRRSNPPTNPSTSSKRKKGSSSSSKKGPNGQSLQEMSPLGDDTGHTMGSEDSSCGLSQGECADNSIQGPESQSPQGSPQKAARKLVFPQEQEVNNPPVTQPQRNVIIADGQTIAMTRPGHGGKATAVLMPANYLLPMSMMKGGQQITIVTNQGPKILNVPHGEAGTTNTLFLQRLISPAGLKPMLTRPGQVRQVRLPANAVQNLQTFNLTTTQNINTQETNWIGTNSVNNQQPKLVVEYSPNVTVGQDVNPDSVKSETSDVQSLKEENMSVGSETLTTPRHSEASSDDLNTKNRSSDEGIFSGQLDSATDDSIQSSVQNRTDQILHHIQVSKPQTNTTVNLIQVHSLNPGEPGKIYSVQNPASLGSLIQLAGKSSASLGQAFQTINVQGITGQDFTKVSPDVQECAQNLLLVRKHYDGQYSMASDGDVEMKSGVGLQQQELHSVEASPSPGPQQSYGIGHHQMNDGLAKVDSDGNVSWSLASNGGSSVPRSVEEASPSYVGYADSPNALVHQSDHQDSNMREGDHERRVLRHQYSPDGASPPPSSTTPRHLYHKMFISSPDKHDHSDKSFHQDHLKKEEHSQSSTVTLHTANSPSFTIHHHQGQHSAHHHPSASSHHSQQGRAGEGGRHGAAAGAGDSARGGHAHSMAHHVLRHKYALMEHELRLQKSLSEECEDLGVDSPSASDLFPEADLLFSASPSSQFDHSQDGQQQGSSGGTTGGGTGGSTLGPTGNTATPTAEGLGPDEEEFARMHPNTTFHSGEIDIVDEHEDITFRSITKRSIPNRRSEIVRSVIEGVGSSGMTSNYQTPKMSAHFSMVGMPRRSTINMSLQSSDDNSEGAEDSMNSAESKDGTINNKHLDGMLSSNITRDGMLNSTITRDVNLSESPGCISSGIIQRNVAQVIRHANEEQMLLAGKDNVGKICGESSPGMPQNGRSFLLENSSDTRQGDSMILKSLMMERDGRDGLTCSSPEQHSELFWESNSNSNQSEEPLPRGPTNLLDFSSEDSNKCCKSPASCEETNSTDSSSMGGINSISTEKPLRLNSVIKTSGNSSTVADGPILHSALTSNLPTSGQEVVPSISRKMELNALHKSDSNTSTSPDGEGADIRSRRTWGRSLKSSGMRRVLSPRSLSAEINMGAEIETSSSEGVNILTKSGGAIVHSGSSTPEDSAVVGRRASLRGSGQTKRSCHCCPPPSPPPLSATVPISHGNSSNITAGSTTSNTPVRGRNRRRPPPPAH